MRRSDCKVDFIRFCKNPSVIFLFQKNDSSRYKGAFDGRASPFLRYTIHAKQKGVLIKGSLCNFQNNAIEIKSDYINYNTYLIPRRTWDIS